MRGLWKLTWLELKIFAREPLGVIGTVGVPVLLFVLLGRAFGRRAIGNPRLGEVVNVEIPILASMLIALSAVLSLVTIVSIYREGGILKRLRATPLRPHTILTAHVLVKLLLTAVTFVLMALAGWRYYPVLSGVPVVRFSLALLIATLSIVSIGFLLASVVPTARFAQPIATVVFYTMLGFSGLFVPIAALPASIRPVARILPLTHAVSLLRGIWTGDSWSAHVVDIGALAVTFALFTVLSSRVFRWE